MNTQECTELYGQLESAKEALSIEPVSKKGPAFPLLKLVFNGYGKSYLSHDQSYKDGLIQGIDKCDCRMFEYETAEDGKQIGFIVPPSDQSEIQQIWVCFGGTGNTALQWLDVLRERVSYPGIAFLLIDYPGYGACSGVPSEESIRRTSADDTTIKLKQALFNDYFSQKSDDTSCLQIKKGTFR